MKDTYILKQILFTSRKEYLKLEQQLKELEKYIKYSIIEIYLII